MNEYWKYAQFAAIVRVKESGTWQGNLENLLGATTRDLINKRLQVVDGDLLALTAGEHDQSVSS